MYMEVLRAMSKRLMSKNGMTNPLLNLTNYDEPILEEEAEGDNEDNKEDDNEDDNEDDDSDNYNIQ